MTKAFQCPKCKLRFDVEANRNITTLVQAALARHRELAPQCDSAQVLPETWAPSFMNIPVRLDSTLTDPGEVWLEQPGKDVKRIV